MGFWAFAAVNLSSSVFSGIAPCQWVIAAQYCRTTVLSYLQGEMSATLDM